MRSPVKTQQFILLFSATCFYLKDHDQFEYKIKGLYIDILVWHLVDTSQFVLLCGYTGRVRWNSCGK